MLVFNSVIEFKRSSYEFPEKVDVYFARNWLKKLFRGKICKYCCNSEENNKSCNKIILYCEMV